MATNAYLERLSELKQKKAESNSARLGIPIQRPLNKQQPGMAGNPLPESSEETVQPESFFTKGFNKEMETDTRFQGFMQEYTDMALGLRDQVQQGFMPEVIAKQRLQQYVQDSASWFSKNKAGAMDHPEMQNLVNGMLEKAYNERQQEGAEEMAVTAPTEEEVQ